ncbi:MAG TPA: lytic transglycosylase domain-containing protein [Blastocatellia bacterium]|nr:lytic transglycosylase domain-containing protein [Blastocatellia bacterium]HMX24725.1 lytic transglycosylase domain-containing protein [Blastocatellia bacterium]HMY72462.1 lytic transglycosylase domain-containing protein [Blastocatellia bacterium]HMZ17414.1 lytic transglycosylase domain-containing protein [Blastocatellia bacterium]HNG29214.1 lytic transglycosylase domain-containing protein [Blastocatellia bacterium]
MTKAELQNLVVEKARQYGIDERIALAQINQESRFNPNAKSPVGAQGLAQFMPGTAQRFGLANPFDPVQAMDAWGKYMTFLLKFFGGRIDLALAGYNWGENRTVLKNAAATGAPFPANQVPAETRNYVQTILKNAGSGAAGGGASSGGSTFSTLGISTGGLLILAILAGLAFTR